jgi:hypothetical protein
MAHPASPTSSRINVNSPDRAKARAWVLKATMEPPSALSSYPSIGTPSDE